MKGIDYPVKIDDNTYNKIEIQNEKIILNVFDCDNKYIYPLYISKRLQTSDTIEIDLIIFRKGEKHHYALINNFSRLMSHLTKHDGQKYWCKKCLYDFSREELLLSHDEDFVKPQKIKMPKKGSTTSFENYQKQMSVPFVIYADFESWLEKPEKNNSSNKKTEVIAKHKILSVGYKLVCRDDPKE